MLPSGSGENRFFGPRQAELFGELGPEARSQLTLERELRHPEHRDEWGNWDGQFAESQDTLRVPGVDRAHRKGAFRWQGKYPFVLALTHDIDTINPYSRTEYWARADRARPGALQRARLAAGRLRYWLRHRLQPEFCAHTQCCWDFNAWVELERKFGFRSTWFVFPEDPQPRSELDCTYRLGDLAKWSGSERLPLIEGLRRLRGLGCEIGLHGSFAGALDPVALRRQREELGRALGVEIESVRQHYLRVDPARTPGVHEAAGFRVDSSVGMNRRIGFRAGTSFPFFVGESVGVGGGRVLEVPLIFQDGAFLAGKSPTVGFEDAKDSARRLLDEVERVNGVFTALFHPHCQSEPMTWELFNWVLEECHRRGAWGATLSELRSSWLAI